MYTIKGKLSVISDTKQVTDSFKKREFVIITDDKQPQKIQFQSSQDNCEMLDKFKIGEQVEVSFFLNGRDWTNPKTNQVMFFNSLNAVKIDYTGESSDAIQGAKHQAETFVAEGDDDLPF